MTTVTNEDSLSKRFGITAKPVRRRPEFEEKLVRLKQQREPH